MEKQNSILFGNDNLKIIYFAFRLMLISNSSFVKKVFNKKKQNYDLFVNILFIDITFISILSFEYFYITFFILFLSVDNI
jgi:hypothetical protein